MDDLRERVAAVERALTDGDGDLTALAEGAATAERVADLEATVEDLQEDVAELEAAAQALRGYVGNVRSVNESVEQRADAAVAAVESLEERVDGIADEPRTDQRGAASDRQPPEREHARQPASDGAGPTPSSQVSGDGVCRSCGQRTPGSQAAADGGDPDAWRGDGGRDPEQEFGAEPTREPPRNGGGGPLDGFDPADGSHRVRIESGSGTDGGLPGTGGDGTGNDGAAKGLVARVCERL